MSDLAHRKLLAELFADAEAHGLGYLEVGFRAHPGQQDAAADYIEARLPFVTDAAVQRGDLAPGPGGEPR
jgi:hypothetical protein